MNNGTSKNITSQYTVRSPRREVPSTGSSFIICAIFRGSLKIHIIRKSAPGITYRIDITCSKSRGNHGPVCVLAQERSNDNVKNFKVFSNVSRNAVWTLPLSEFLAHWSIGWGSAFAGGRLSSDIPPDYRTQPFVSDLRFQI